MSSQRKYSEGSQSGSSKRNGRGGTPGIVGIVGILAAGAAIALALWQSGRARGREARRGSVGEKKSVGRAVSDPAFQPTVENTARPRGPAPEGMVWIPGGEFSMGSTDPTVDTICGGHEPMNDARPIHRV